MLQHPNSTFRQLLNDLYRSNYTFLKVWDILPDKPARPIRDWPDGVGLNSAPLADGASIVFPFYPQLPLSLPFPPTLLLPLLLLLLSLLEVLVWRKGK